MSRKKVLIIDDEADFCMLLKTYFLRKEYEVYLSYSLSKGMQLLEQVKPDVLLLDNNLPDGLGWNKIEFILEHFPELDLHLMSAYYYSPPKIKDSVHIWEKPLRLQELSKHF